MKLLSELRTLMEFSAVSCAAGGGKIERVSVPLHHAEIDLPESDLDGILITGDLQFYDRKDVPEDDRRLMGHVVADEIHELCNIGLLPPASKLGIILVGDLYAEPSLLKRGGSGDVDEIWKNFGEKFRWVTGVAGNHDLFEGADTFSSALKRIDNIHPLNGDLVELDQIKVGGISGIAGNLRRPWRYDSLEFQKAAQQLLEFQLDFLILHQGPVGSKRGMRGAGLVNEVIRAAEAPLITTFGHCHWPEPLDFQESDTFINTDARVVLLTRPGANVALTPQSN